MFLITGKAGEVSSVMYKVGECMLELVKLWKDYESENNGETETLEIRIPAEHVTATNRQVSQILSVFFFFLCNHTNIFLTYISLSIYIQVRGGQLWGTDIYTDDSDLVAGNSSISLLVFVTISFPNNSVSLHLQF